MNANFEAMQEAMNDELFLADLREVMDDFREVDAEMSIECSPLALDNDSIRTTTLPQIHRGQ